MNLALIDWLIMIGIVAVMLAGVLMTRGFMRSVADFLAAGRTAGRYVLSVSQGLAMLGAITVVANLEMNYVAGFSLVWWGFTTAVIVLILTVTGWVIYRFRQTRCMTLAEFFERRYSRRFRIFAGIICFVSGLINFSIFPAVGARFFINYCGFPPSVEILGLAIGTFPLMMFLLLGIALYFVFAGGQIAVIVTDFLQGVFANIVFVVVTLYVLHVVGWTDLFSALSTAPADASLINPFKTSHVQDFNIWYQLIGTFGVIYVVMSWQGTQGYHASAHDAHETKMAAVLSNWRILPQNLLLVLVPVIAYAVMRLPDYLNEAAAVETVLNGAGGEAVANQLRVPMVLANLLPPGLLGAFAAMMLAAFVSTHDTYLHSWGTLFVQDVVLPLRGRPFTPKQHLRVLRLSICGVAVFIFFFSWFFEQTQYIMLFMAITGSIFAGGAGAVIAGGLYWKRGTTAAAWCAMISGASISVGGILIHQFTEDFPINGQMFWGIAMGISILVYVSVSLLTKRGEFDLDRLLNRGAHAIEGETRRVSALPSRGLRALGIGREFSIGDRVITIASYAWIFTWVAVFIVGTVINLTRDVPDESWADFWKIYMQIQVGAAIVVIVWFTIGGVRDLKRMLGSLAVRQRDDSDNGLIARGEKE